MSRFLSAIVMGGLLLALSGTLDALTLERSAATLWAPWLVWLACLAVIAAIAWRTTSPRRSWGVFSAINGGMCWALVLAISTQPLPEWAPYREGVPATSIDLTLPVGAFLGSALLSGYLGIAAVVCAIVFSIAALWLLLTHGGSNRQAHGHDGKSLR